MTVATSPRPRGTGPVRLPNQRLSGRLWIAFGRALGGLAWLLRIRRRVVLENLARAFPSLDEAARRTLARSSYASLGTGLGEILLSRTISDGELADWVSFDGFERYEQAAAEGHGVVVVIAHFGNWELLGRACAKRGVQLATITRKMNGWANRRIAAARAGSGLAQLPDRGATADALALLRRNGVLAIAVDQNMREKRGIFVDFFSHPACTTPAAAVYALRAGAPIIAAFPVRQPDGSHRVLVQGPFVAPPELRGHAAIQALTQELTRAVEAIVRAHPEQWYWLHRRWKTQPRAPVKAQTDQLARRTE